MVLSEMERLALCSIGEVMSVFKGRHEFNRKIRKGKKQVKVFPGGGDTMILPRKLFSHGSIQKEKVVLRCRCKTGQMLSQSCPEASSTPSRLLTQKILTCLSLSRVVLLGKIGSGSESSANTDYQLESLTEPELLWRNRPACHLRKTHL